MPAIGMRRILFVDDASATVETAVYRGFPPSHVAFAL